MMAQLGGMYVKGQRRVVCGVIDSITFEGERPHTDHLAIQVSVRLVPHAALLRLRKGSRIFRRRRVDEIIHVVAAGLQIDTAFDLHRPYPEQDYTTQYEESDYDFIRRLAAENGLYFYFQQPLSALDHASAGFAAENYVFCCHVCFSRN
mgnify:CR=1 FL=1